MPTLSTRDAIYKDWLAQIQMAAKDCDPNDFDYLLGVGFKLQFLRLEDVIFWSSCR